MLLLEDETPLSFLDVQDSADEHTSSAAVSSCNFFRVLEFLRLFALLMYKIWYFGGLLWNVLVKDGHSCDVWNTLESLYFREVHMMVNSELVSWWYVIRENERRNAGCPFTEI